MLVFDDMITMFGSCAGTDKFKIQPACLQSSIHKAPQYLKFI